MQCQEQYGSGQGEDYWSTGQARALPPLGTYETSVPWGHPSRHIQIVESLVPEIIIGQEKIIRLSGGLKPQLKDTRQLQITA